MEGVDDVGVCAVVNCCGDRSDYLVEIGLANAILED
jgi:hypothetical protein